MPAEFVQPRPLRDGGKFLAMGALPYLTRTIEVQPTGTADLDIFVEYRELFTADGAGKVPKAHGLSGSGLWLVNPRQDGVWTPDLAKLVAIQHSAFGDPPEYLRGTLIREWLKMLQEDIPELASAIEPVLAAR